MKTLEKNEGAAPWSASAPFVKDENHGLSIPASEKISNPIAAQFLSLLAEEELVTFQTFDDVKERSDTSLVRILHGTLDQHLPVLTELNKKSAGVFFTVNATDLRGRKTENITRVRAVFIDLDGASLEPVLSAPLSPHVIIESSPKRFHAYWLVEGVPLEEFSSVQKALIQLFDADPAVHDLPRVMRLPGFYHNKGDSVLVQIVESFGTVAYKYPDFLRDFRIDPSLHKKRKGPQLGISHDPILEELGRRGMIRRAHPSKSGIREITCPWAGVHTTGDKGTVYFEPNTNGYQGAGFKCQHAHCEGKTIRDLQDFLGIGQQGEATWEDPIELKEELLPVSPLLREMLPEALCPWMMDVAERMQVPLDFLAASCVVVLGSLIGRKIGVFPKARDDWLVIPNLWGAVVGRPSLLKSPAIGEIMKPLEELVERAIHKHREEEEEHEYKKMWLEAQKEARKNTMKKAAKSPASEMPDFSRLEIIDKPALKRYKTEDATVEKIGEILLENPQGILIHRDELIGWLKGLDKYGREGDRAFFLESWNGNGSYTVDRIARGTLHIPALCLSIIGGIPPGPLGLYVHQAAGGGGGDDGLLQRFQVLVWPDASKTWKNVDRMPDSDAKKKALEVFYNIDAFEPLEPPSKPGFKTHALRFSAEAQMLFDEWRDSLEKQVRSGDLGPALESHLAKYRSLMPSLSLIFYIVETVGKGRVPTTIDAQSAKQAILWCDYLKTHAGRLYASGEDPGMESARALLERIKRGDLPEEFSSRYVYHSKHWAKLSTADQVNSAIKILKEFGWLKIEIIQTPGRSSNKIIVHPSLRSSQ